MTCEEAREAFTDLYDGTLSGPPLVALSRHLDGCPTCRREWVAFRLTAGALGELRDEEPSPGFAARVAERIEAPRGWRRLASSLVFPLRLKLPIHAAALVMLGVAGLWVSQRSPEIQRAANPGAPPVERPVTVSPPATVPDVPTPEARLATQKPPAPVAPRSAPPAPAPPAAAKIEAPAIVREEQAAPPPPPGGVLSACGRGADLVAGEEVGLRGFGATTLAVRTRSIRRARSIAGGRSDRRRPRREGGEGRRARPPDG